jgi:O-acetyl-ADP-ribose deacetylase (regulator of RNase III)
MVEIREGSVLDADAQTLVNTVNCVGVMGKGIALAFKEQFPSMFRDYAARCEREEVHLGEPYLFRQLFPPWILNFPTKGHWRARSRLKDIEAGLAFLEAHYREWGIESLAVPPLGCGQGGLSWSVVGPMLERHFAEYDIPVTLWVPSEAESPALVLESTEGKAGAGDGEVFVSGSEFLHGLDPERAKRDGV